MARSRELGMQTFDQALFDLYVQRLISYEEALRNADSANELRLAIKLKSKRGAPERQAQSLSLDEIPSEDELEAARLEQKRRLQEQRDAAELARIQASRGQSGGSGG